LARAPRSWGYWTEGKLDILAKYLDRFTTATKNRAQQRIYLDAFAGEPTGTSRTTGMEVRGSARLALEVKDPPFDRCYFFELRHKADALREELLRNFPGRDIRVEGGDCNKKIPDTLATLRSERLGWVPTFAFLDPDGMELRWDTIREFAAHKLRGPRPSRFKVELWVLFPSAGLIRTLALSKETLPDREADRASGLFGSDAWSIIYRLRQMKRIEGQEARERYVNLYRWLLEQELGYYRTHALQINNRMNNPIYHLVFATDNPTGDKIMTHLYGEALTRFPQMREHARRRGPTGEQLGLFGEADDAATYARRAYVYEPPVDPASIDS
jgi:three-Cys-motif partner protein